MLATFTYENVRLLLLSASPAHPAWALQRRRARSVATTWRTSRRSSSASSRVAACNLHTRAVVAGDVRRRLERRQLRPRRARLHRRRAARRAARAATRSRSRRAPLAGGCPALGRRAGRPGCASTRSRSATSARRWSASPTRTTARSRPARPRPVRRPARARHPPRCARTSSPSAAFMVERTGAVARRRRAQRRPGTHRADRRGAPLLRRHPHGRRPGASRSSTPTASLTRCRTSAILGTSVFPTTGGHNPTLTLQALAWRTAQRLVAHAGARPG